MSDEVIVYWTPVRFPEVTPAIDLAIHDLNNIVGEMSGDLPGRSTSIINCPAITGTLKNTFRVKSNLNYDLTWSDNGFHSSQKNQEFFNKYVKIRDTKTGLVSIDSLGMLFFTEAPSLIMEVKNATYARNNFRSTSIFTEGSFDIGKWYRPTEISFFFMNKNSTVNICYDDSLYYVKFLTEKKVRLKKYHFTRNLADRLDGFIVNRDNIKDNFKDIKFINKLQKYYNAFEQSRYKSYILKEIKNNLME
jgi:hypothetical protein